MYIKKHIPNFITSLNLLCGCLAIVYAFNNNLIVSSYLVATAAVLDFLDGFAARLLKVHSDIGKQLDSLADMVTFGVVPSVIMFHLLKNNSNEYPFIQSNLWVLYLPFSIAIFSALRLAKFNIDDRQADSFIGVPTPANTILIASFPLIIQSENFLVSILLNPYFLLGLSVLMSYLLVAEIPLFALKFKNFHWSDNKIRFCFLGTSILLLIIFHVIAIPFIIFLYIVLSLINNRLSKK